MVKKNGNGSVSLAVAPSAALVELDWDELETDGMEEVNADDIRIAKKLCNARTTDSSGEPVPDNVWFDTVTEEQKRELRLAFLTITKANSWVTYDESEGRSTVHCESLDQKTGVLSATGEVRSCDGCIDKLWRTDEKGKRGRNCSPVYTVLAVDREALQPCLLTFRRSSLPVLQAYLNKHHIKRGPVVNGKRLNVPLFAYEVRATLKMNDAPRYALPVLERGDVLPPEEIRAHAAEAKRFREQKLRHLQQLAQQDQREVESMPVLDPYVEPAAAAGKRF